MDVRERLVELVGQVQDCGCDVTNVVEMNYVENITLVDHLIAHGVTMKEPQKPLTAEEAKDFVLWDRNKPPLLWIEYKTNKEKNRYMYIETVNEVYQLLRILSSYGNNVRCWIERPTDEEMEAAEWE